MTLNPIDLKLLALAIIAFFWHLSVYRLKIIPFDYKKMAYDQNRLATGAFGLFLLITILIPSSIPGYASYLVSLACAYTFAGFAILYSYKQETFWQKRRNRMLGLGSLTALAVILPQFVTFPIFFPIVYGMVTAQICHSSSHAFFIESMKDLEGVRKKILEVNAQRSIDKVVANSASAIHHSSAS